MVFFENLVRSGCVADICLDKGDFLIDDFCYIAEQFVAGVYEVVHGDNSMTLFIEFDNSVQCYIFGATANDAFTINRFKSFLAFCYDLTIDLRGMNFLVFPYNAVLNDCVFDDAVVADCHVGADGAVLDDHVFADVARGN